MRSGNEGMTLLAQGPDSAESNPSRIARLVRTPEGQGLAISREDSVEAWQLHRQDGTLHCVNRFPKAQLLSILDYGKLLALYNDGNDTPKITLFDTLQAKSVASVDIPALVMLFCLPFGESHTLIGITATHQILRIKIRESLSQGKHQYELVTLPLASLPYQKPIVLVTAIDPMAWSRSTKSQNERAHDILMSLSDDGELVFWYYDELTKPNRWLRTGRVRTGRTGYRHACCSSAKKTALGIL